MSFWLSHVLHHININVYAKFHHNIPLSSRDRTIFTFSEFEPLQCLGQSQMTVDNLLGYMLSISLRLQNFIKIFQTVWVIDIFHEQANVKIVTNRPASKSSQTVRWQNQMFDYRALLEIQVSDDFLRVVQLLCLVDKWSGYNVHIKKNKFYRYNYT